MKKAIYILLLAALFTPSIAMGQNKDNISSDAKIDSIYRLQKKIYAESKAGPLADKKYGVEVNLFRVLMIDQFASFSGTFSLFNVNRQAEIAFPIYYQQSNDAYTLTELTVDCHYRYFLGQVQNGFYLSGFTRFAYLNGNLTNNNSYDPYNTPSAKKGKEAKLGLGVGIGYRKFSKKGLYWGTSLSLGRYVIGKNERFGNSYFSMDDDSSIIVDFEFLKFGWAF